MRSRPQLESIVKRDSRWARDSCALGKITLSRRLLSLCVGIVGSYALRRDPPLIRSVGDREASASPWSARLAWDQRRARPLVPLRVDVTSYGKVASGIDVHHTPACRGSSNRSVPFEADSRSRESTLRLSSERAKVTEPDTKIRWRITGGQTQMQTIVMRCWTECLTPPTQ